MKKCCANCKHLVSTPKNNRYNDYEYFCMKTGYYTHAINRDRTNFESYAPGGKKLNCVFEPSKNINY